jgi:hypothetical protein
LRELDAPLGDQLVLIGRLAAARTTRSRCTGVVLARAVLLLPRHRFIPLYACLE